jgi:hypothetical protein
MSLGLLALAWGPTPEGLSLTDIPEAFLAVLVALVKWHLSLALRHDTAYKPNSTARPAQSGMPSRAFTF